MARPGFLSQGKMDGLGTTASSGGVIGIDLAIARMRDTPTRSTFFNEMPMRYLWNLIFFIQATSPSAQNGPSLGMRMIRLSMALQESFCSETKPMPLALISLICPEKALSDFCLKNTKGRLSLMRRKNLLSFATLSSGMILS